MSRLRQHRNELVRGEHLLQRLQWDWDTYGAGCFEFLYRPTPPCQQDTLEKACILLFGSLEHQGGYNKMFGGSQWGPTASIRDTERKLRRKAKFCGLPGLHEDRTMHPDYVASFCRGSTPLMRSLGLEETPYFKSGIDDIRWALLPLLLQQFSRLEYLTDAAATNSFGVNSTA